MLEFNKRNFTALVVRTVIQFAAADIIADALAKTAPKSEKLRMNEAAGQVGGYLVANAAGKHTDKLVDKAWDKIDARKKNNLLITD